jgi:glycine betaine transporter
MLIIAALPFALVIILMGVSFYKDIRSELRSKSNDHKQNVLKKGS